jgi:DNA-binding FadR family transcriptional regulator
MLAAVEQLGRIIVTSRPGYRPGQVVSLEMVSQEAGVSRAMAREVLQVLNHKRLVRLQPRVGATVLPVEKWDVFDPDVIKWRLGVAPRFQIRSLSEVRQAIEPMAAALAAERASADVCRDLVSLSAQLQDLGRDKRFKDTGTDGDACRKNYQAVDEEFHRALLKGSQNEMFHALADPAMEALNYRIQENWEGARGPRGGIGGDKPFPVTPSPLSLWMHRGLAAAVEQGRPSAAEAFARAILLEFRDTPFPQVIGAALELALPELDLAVMGAGAGQFEEAVTGAARAAKEAASGRRL